MLSTVPSVLSVCCPTSVTRSPRPVPHPSAHVLPPRCKSVCVWWSPFAANIRPHCCPTRSPCSPCVVTRNARRHAMVTYRARTNHAMTMRCPSVLEALLVCCPFMPRCVVPILPPDRCHVAGTHEDADAAGVENQIEMQPPRPRNETPRCDRRAPWNDTWMCDCRALGKSNQPATATLHPKAKPDVTTVPREDVKGDHRHLEQTN